jgi:hypothetical protein
MVIRSELCIFTSFAAKSWLLESGCPSVSQAIIYRSGSYLLYIEYTNLSDIIACDLYKLNGFLVLLKVLRFFIYSHHTIDRGSWTSAYGIWNLWNELPDLIFPEPWRGKYSNPVTNFINSICHMHECKILFITHLSLIRLNAYSNLFSISQSVWRGNFWLCYCLTSSIPLWRRL